jgi:hypothetical protein
MGESSTHLFTHTQERRAGLGENSPQRGCEHPCLFDGKLTHKVDMLVVWEHGGWKPSPCDTNTMGESSTHLFTHTQGMWAGLGENSPQRGCEHPCHLVAKHAHKVNMLVV